MSPGRVVSIDWTVINNSHGLPQKPDSEYNWDINLQTRLETELSNKGKPACF